MHTEYWNKQQAVSHAAKVRARPVQPNYNVAWVQLCAETLCQHKNVYLYGPTGIGKTVLINYLTTNNCGTIFLPCGTTDWEFGAISNGTAYAVAGDAPLDYLLSHRSKILRLLDKDPTCLNVKCGQYKTVVFEGIFVVISNFPPPIDPAILRRFTVIHANEDGFQTIKPEIQTINEDQEDHEAIIISSDEEDVEVMETNEVRPSSGEPLYFTRNVDYQFGDLQWRNSWREHGSICKLD